MSKKYQSKDGLVIASGKIESISEDKMSAVMTVQTWDIKENKYIDEALTIKTLAPIEDEKAGDIATVQGWNFRGVVQAEVFSKENIYATVDTNKVDKDNNPIIKSVLAGTVLFASENKELDENGQPRLNQAGQPRKPHFDITIAVGTGEERVTHTVKIYDRKGFTTKDGRSVPEQKNIERYKKLFANFDRESNPIYCQMITTPGTAWVKAGEYNGQPVNYQNESHMGADVVNVTFLNEKVKEQTTAKEEPKKETVKEEVKTPEVVETPTPAVETKAPATEEANGFDAGIDLDDAGLGLDDFEIDG